MLRVGEGSILHDATCFCSANDETVLAERSLAAESTQGGRRPVASCVLRLRSSSPAPRANQPLIATDTWSINHARSGVPRISIGCYV